MSFSQVFKFNPYHDKRGRFASASGGTSQDSSGLIHSDSDKTLYRFMNPLGTGDEEPIVPGPTTIEGVSKALEGTGFHAAISNDTMHFGTRIIDLNDDSPASEGVRLALEPMKQALASLPQDAQEALRAIKPTLAMNDLQDALGVTNLEESVMGLSYSDIANGYFGLDRQAQEELKDKYFERGAGYSRAGNVWKDFNGENDEELTIKQVKGVVIHETGHLLTSKTTLARAMTGVNIIRKEFLSKGFPEPSANRTVFDWMAHNISEYSTVNGNEFIAESFAKFHSPDYVQGSMPDWWEKMVKTMPSDKVDKTGKVKKAEVVMATVWPVKPKPFLSEEWWRYQEWEDDGPPLPRPPRKEGGLRAHPPKPPKPPPSQFNFGKVLKGDK